MASQAADRKRKELLPYLWGAAREFYVRGAIRNGSDYWPSAAEVAAAYGLSRGGVQKAIKRDDWDRDREAYRRDREQAFASELRRRAEDEGRQLAEQHARFDDDTFRLATAALRRVAEGLAHIRMYEPTLDAQGNPAFRIPRGAAYTLAQLSMALLNAQKAGRLSIGESTENLSTRGDRLPLEQLFAYFGNLDHLTVEQLEALRAAIEPPDDAAAGQSGVQGDGAADPGRRALN